MQKKQLNPYNYAGFECLLNTDLGYAPYFSNEISYRIKKKLANNCVGTGEAGISKSYTISSLCRVQSPRFSVDDVVFTYAQYMKQILAKRRKGVPIMFDEPQYALDKRDWFKEPTKALVKTITSQRFRLRPLYIPIINLNLLEKTLRSYLIQYHIIMTDIGEGYVYRLYPSQTQDKLYRYKVCKIEYGLFDVDLCDRDSCLDCPDLFKQCDIFRAQYERKKLENQTAQDEQSLMEAEILEAKQLTDDQLIDTLYDNLDKLYNDKGKIDVSHIRAVLLRAVKYKLGKNKAYYLRTLLYYDHPELAPEIEDTDIPPPR